MSKQKQYHNITQANFYQTDIYQLIDEMNEGDVLAWNYRGNELSHYFTEEENNKLKEDKHERF